MGYANNTSETIQRILKAIKEEALEPSETEAKEILASAKAESEQLLLEANERAKNIVTEANSRAQELTQAAKSELSLALKQARLQLKNDLSQNLFKKELHELVSKKMKQPDLVADIIKIVIDSMGREGLFSPFSLTLPETVHEQELMQLLSQEIRSKIEQQGELVFTSKFGGVTLHLKEKNMVIELTEEQIEEILDRYLSDSLKAFILND